MCVRVGCSDLPERPVTGEYPYGVCEAIVECPTYV